MVTIRTGQQKRGYSLIEVIVGTGLLAVIAMTIVGLFIQGRKDVQSGRNLTTALSITQHVAEDLDQIPYTNLWSSWQLATGTTTSQNHTRATVQFRKIAGIWNAEFVTSNPTYSGECPTGGPVALTATIIYEPLKTQAGAWKDELDTLPQPSLRIQFTPMFDLDDDGTVNFTNNRARFLGAAIIRMEVTVNWIEGERARSVTLPQVRTFNEV